MHNYNLSDDKDFIFDLVKIELTIYTYLINYNFSVIIVKNNFKFTIQIPYNYYINIIIENEYIYNYIIVLEDTILIIKISRKKQ